MRKFPRLGRLAMALGLAGGSLFALDSCDPTVKATILGGLESSATGLADTFITALFQKMAAEDTSGTSTTTTTGTTT